ncbi:MAG: glycosyltransferase family 39 protein [Chlorobium sp.]|nr:glycosyltransferase family 39 protein [Chlorobium sp.]
MIVTPCLKFYRIVVGSVESKRAISLFILSGLFSLGVFRNIHLPGIYVDAVNPDYLAAKIISGSQYISHFPPWDAFPVLGNWYHGVMHTYFGLIFFSIFGFSIFSLRIAHAIFGVGILLISHMILSKATGSRFFSLLIIGTLAIDPAFIFAFRTQNYITLSPLFFLLVSFYLLLLMSNNNDVLPRWKRFSIASGVLSGWSFYGYFIYIFFLPAFVIMLAHLSRKFSYSWLRIILFWLTGFTLGAFLYFYGYARLLVEYNDFSEVVKQASGISITGEQVASEGHIFTFG